MLELKNISFQVDSEGKGKEIIRNISMTVPITTVERAAMLRSRSRSHQPSSANSSTAAIVSSSCLSMSFGAEDAATDMPRLVR